MGNENRSSEGINFTNESIMKNEIKVLEIKIRSSFGEPADDIN